MHWTRLRGQLDSAGRQASAGHADVFDHKIDGGAHILLSLSPLRDKHGGVHTSLKKAGDGSHHNQSHADGNHEFQ